MNRFDHFRELRVDLSELLGGVVDAVASPRLLRQDRKEQRRVLTCLIEWLIALFLPWTAPTAVIWGTKSLRTLDADGAGHGYRMDCAAARRIH